MRGMHEVDMGVLDGRPNFNTDRGGIDEMQAAVDGYNQRRLAPWHAPRPAPAPRPTLLRRLARTLRRWIMRKES
jgi:hypothetical protein